MSNEKRFLLFLILSFASITGIQYFMIAMGWGPPPPPRNKPPVAQAAAKEQPQAKDQAPGLNPPVAAAKGLEAKVEGAQAAGEKPAVQAAKPKKPDTEFLKPSELALGSVTDSSVGGYRIMVQLDQVG